MTLKIKYVYDTWTEECGCCSYSAQYLEFDYIDDTKAEYWEEQCNGFLCENEEEFRDYLREKFPDIIEYEIDKDSRWF